MARSQHPDLGRLLSSLLWSQPHPTLDGQYAAFGKVLEGMEAVDNIVNQKGISETGR